MNLLFVLQLLIFLLAIIGLFMLAPVVVALLYGEVGMISPFLVPAAVALLAGTLLLLLFRRSSRVLHPREGFLLVSLAWLSAAALGALPYVLSGAVPSFIDAFFETMSGFSTTGATILPDIEGISKSLLFWRSLTHWLGGMGIIVLTVAIFPLLGVGGLQLMKAEAPGPSLDKITPKVTETAKILWSIYLLLTVVQTGLLMFGGMDLYDALTHTFGTVATGGFSPRADSVGYYQSPFIQNVITLFMVMAGVNFIMYYKLLIRQMAPVWQDEELRWYLSIFFIATGIITVSLVHNQYYPTFQESVRYAAFQTASILTTTGYATADFVLWPYTTQAVLFMLMFFGGSAGSTGGGIKIIRIITMVKQGLHELKYLLHPRGVFRLSLNGATVQKEFLYTVSGFVALYIMALLVTTLVVSTGGFDITTSFTTALATLGNIGPGFALVGPTENYAFFPDYIKLFLSFVMMVGRLEIYTVLVLFSPFYWRR